MITFQNLTKAYGSFTAVDDITFRVTPGTICGFLIPNGAGKSPSMRCLVAQGTQAELLATTDDLEELFINLTESTSREGALV